MAERVDIGASIQEREQRSDSASVWHRCSSMASDDHGQDSDGRKAHLDVIGEGDLTVAL